jgi:hypothetical protein
MSYCRCWNCFILCWVQSMIPLKFNRYISFRNKASWCKDTVSFRCILSYFPVCVIIHKIPQFKKPCSIGMVDWLWHGESNVSELRPHGTTIVHPRVIAVWTMVWWYRLGLTPNSSTRALWQPPVLSGGPVSKEISGASRRMGEGNENLVYSSLCDFKSSFTCRKIVRHGTFPLYFPSERKVCCGILSPLKTIGLAGFEPATFGSSRKHTNHYTNEATSIGMKTYRTNWRLSALRHG